MSLVNVSLLTVCNITSYRAFQGLGAKQVAGGAEAIS